jgi:hypothetical protein
MTFTEFSDLVKIGLFCIACLLNKQAVFVLCLHVANFLIFVGAGHDPNIYYCSVATMFAVASIANITLLSEIRYVLLAFAVLNWIAAIDFMLSPYQTLFGMCYPWLVNGFDVLILYLLFRHRGKECDGRTRSSINLYMVTPIAIVHNINLRLARLYLLQRFKKQDPK